MCWLNTLLQLKCKYLFPMLCNDKIIYGYDRQLYGPLKCKKRYFDCVNSNNLDLLFKNRILSDEAEHPASLKS